MQSRTKLKLKLPDEMHSCFAPQPALLGLLVALQLLSAAAADDTAMLRFYDEYHHECVRDCRSDPRPRVCRYSFRLEWFQTMSRACFSCPLNITDCLRPHCITGDGFKRALLSVNRQLSGPGIHACDGDTIEVLVDNKMEMGEGTSIHWHGIQHTDGTQHMDGVSQVTQCAIGCHSAFTYRFTASPPGTHFWHSHSGMQRVEGVYGPLVIRQTADPHSLLYDFDLPEHTLVLADWTHELAASKFANHHFSNGNNKPEGIVINGRGAYQPAGSGTNDTLTPRYVLKLQPGSRYRIRVISNGALNCPFEVSVANHSLLAIASDGAPFQPVTVDSIIVFAGERFDFVLTANQSVGNYLLKVVGFGDCDTRFFSARQSAIVSYAGADETALQGLGNPSYASMLTGGRQLNPFNRLPGPGDFAVTALKSLQPPDPQLLAPLPDVKFYLAFDFEKINNPRFHDPIYYPISAVPPANGFLFTPQMNNVAMNMPSAPPIHQMNELSQDDFCNNTEFNPLYVTTFKACIHALRIKLNQVVEIVLIDKGVTFDANHPFHLHGHYFAVIGMDKLGSNTSVQQVKTLDASGMLGRNLLDKPVLKDTVTVPDGGYTVVRFRASNPGPWLLHCHLEFHVESGMGVLLLVGDPADWASRVPANFPRCGNWQGPAATAAMDAAAQCRRDVLGLGLGLGLGAVVLAAAAVAATFFYMQRRGGTGQAMQILNANDGASGDNLATMPAVSAKSMETVASMDDDNSPADFNETSLHF